MISNQYSDDYLQSTITYNRPPYTYDLRRARYLHQHCKRYCYCYCYCYCSNYCG